MWLRPLADLDVKSKISKCQQLGISVIFYIYLITSTIMNRRTTLWRSLVVLHVKKSKGHFFDKLIRSQILLTSTMMSSYMWWRSWADSVKVWESRRADIGTSGQPHSFVLWSCPQLRSSYFFHQQRGFFLQMIQIIQIGTYSIANRAV